MSTDNQKKILLFSSALAAFLVLCELALRVFHIGPDIAVVHRENYRLSDNPELMYELVPGSKDGSSAINSDGMRDREREIAKPEKTIRIACIGDSICYGLEVPRDQAFPARLETLLNEYYSDTGMSFEVMNFGVTGYNIGQTVENTRLKALKYRPDIIVYAYCLNEPQQYSFEMASIRAMMTDAEKEYSESRRKLLNSRLLTLLRYAVRSKTSRGRSKGDAPKLREEEKVWASLYGGTYPKYFSSLYSDEASWGPVESGFSELADISRTRGIPVFVTVFPVLMHFDKYPLKNIHAQVEQSCRQNALEVIDLLEIMSQYELLQKKRAGWDALHPNADGHGVAAIALFMGLTKKEPLKNLPAPAL